MTGQFSFRSLLVLPANELLNRRPLTLVGFVKKRNLKARVRDISVMQLPSQVSLNGSEGKMSQPNGDCPKSPFCPIVTLYIF